MAHLSISRTTRGHCPPVSPLCNALTKAAPPRLHFTRAAVTTTTTQAPDEILVGQPAVLYAISWQYRTDHFWSKIRFGGSNDMQLD